MAPSAHKGGSKRMRLARDDGFTLIETVLVCALIGLMTAVAVPSYTAFVESRRVMYAANLVSSDIRLTQIEAQRAGKRARFSFLSDPITGEYVGYEIQVGNSAAASASCSANDYTTVKRVELKQDFSARITDPVLDCLIFEPVGRTGWTNPAVLESSSVPVTDYAGWVVLFDGGERVKASSGSQPLVCTDGRVATWGGRNCNDTPSAQVVLTLDLGQERFVREICPQTLEAKSFEGIWFPASITLDWSPVTGSTPPQPGEWQSVGQLAAPYATAAPLYPGSPIQRACPSFEVNRRVRYLRFTFDTRWLDGSTGTLRARKLSLDEIKLTSPGVRVESLNGRTSRSVAVTPVTGATVVK